MTLRWLLITACVACSALGQGANHCFLAIPRHQRAQTDKGVLDDLSRWWPSLSPSPLSPSDCTGISFNTLYPRLVNGSETESRVTVLVALSAAATVTCAAFVPRTLINPLPSVDLIFEPVIDPWLQPQDRPDIYKTDPVGRYFLSRSQPVAAPVPNSPVPVDVYVSFLQSGWERFIQVNCAAQCAANASFTTVSNPTSAMLLSCECL